MRSLFVGMAGCAVALTSAVAGAAQPVDRSICLLLDSAAAAQSLPVEFLTRIIWRESRFDPEAVGPHTRSGARAQGIAQFMPRTAAERGLLDPFDPVEALPQAAAFLSELRREFGNLGLAAAAYNAGPHRVRAWLNGQTSLPAETQRYVRAVTGRDAGEWSQKGAVEFTPHPRNCEQTVASLDRGGDFAIALREHVTSALGRPWGVELAAGFSRAQVLSSYARAMQRIGDLAGAHDPIITAGMLRSRGAATFYRAQIGTDTRAAATDLCAHIRRKGEACVVVRMAARK